jgi:hypothetical protein
MKLPHSFSILILCFAGVISFSSCKKLTEETVCLAPTGIILKSLTDTSVILEWSPAEEAEQYIVKVVETGESWTGALEKRTTGTSATIAFDNLKAGLNYVAKVQTNCAGANSEFSPEVSFFTLPEKVFDLTRKWRISRLQSNGINMVLQSGDFAEFKSPDVYIQQLLGSASNGKWSLNGASMDTLVLNAGAERKYRIRALSASFFRGVGLGSIAGDTLELLPY